MKARERFIVFTNAYPYRDLPYYGTYVADEVAQWRANGVDVEVFFINGRKSRWNYVTGVLAWLWKMLREGSTYDAIVVHHSYCCLVASVLKPPDLPLIYQVHEGTLHFSRVSRWLVRRAVRRADRVVYVSPMLPRRLAIPAGESDVIPCGIDLALFRPQPREEARRALGWDPGEEIVLYAAKERQYYERFDLVCAAVEALRREGRSPRLVRLEGVPREEVPTYLNAADVLVLASRGEGCPNIVKEALACNRPVVALRVGTVPELLEGVESGFLCEDNVPSLAEQLKKALALKGAGSGRSRAATYSIEATSRAFLEVCRAAASWRRWEAVRG
jgi:glycosyltransferase involved in cell wall biosynthesis